MQHVRWCLLALLALPFACQDDACDSSSCGAGFACLSDGACHPQRGLRDPCESDLDCTPGLFCLAGDTGTGSGYQCSRGTGEPGEPCGTASTSAVLTCAPGSSCVYRSSYSLASFAGGGVGAVAFWADTREGFIATQGPSEDICVVEASLQQGEQCNNDSDCALGLICHQGYTPNQCQPRSSDGQPCTFSSDCVSDYCELRRLDDGSLDFTADSCALADPSCDIRVDPSCDHWLSCRVCKPRSDLTGTAPDAGAPDAGAPEAAAPDAGTPDAAP
jgi:hypothetical protein